MAVVVAETFLGLLERYDPSFLRTLSADPDEERFAPNKTSREVKQGHYVRVAPTPLPQPTYVAHSRHLLATLGVVNQAEAQSEAFVRFFSGDLAAVESKVPRFGWATPYALSIFGQEMTSNCPFRTGNGYGDGRAISVLELSPMDGAGGRWELQLKGGGTTPFCRGGDGRAVLRSSVREFLVSEAMHHLGVPTCRSLSLIASKIETVGRMWYADGTESEDPDKFSQETTAITTRVAPSLIRVGQLELFGRRCRRNDATQRQAAMQELAMLLDHAIDREYPLVAAALFGTREEKYLAFVAEFGQRLAVLVAEWIRVGYCQGNFNSDNCAIGGRTLDYGPFGFVEKYSATYQMWIGGGEHFSFLSQPTAAAMNFKMLCTAVAPLLAHDEDRMGQLNALLRKFPNLGNTEVERMFARKLGLPQAAGNLTHELLELMEESLVDYTIFWRELSALLPTAIDQLLPSNDARTNACCFYEPAKIGKDLQQRWNDWIKRWQNQLLDAGRSRAVVQEQMLAANPKFVPREWMLVEAYRSLIDRNDVAVLKRMQLLFEEPYSEHLDAPEMQKYYRRASDGELSGGGTSRMS